MSIGALGVDGLASSVRTPQNVGGATGFAACFTDFSVRCDGRPLRWPSFRQTLARARPESLKETLTMMGAV
jgi:hypothetical protein